MTLVLRRPSPGPLTSPFGPRPAPLTYHHGIDYGWYTAAPDYRVYAAAAGTVTRVWETSTMGLIIEIDHGDGYRTRYNHLAGTLVQQGDQVKVGQHIGTMGNSGTAAAGTHLHFELWVNGVRVDPAPYFTTTAGAGGTSIIPERKKHTMASLYHKQNSAPTLYALAGDSPGTPANWLETTAQSLANAWSAQIGGPSAGINAETWDVYKADYLAPLAIAGTASTAPVGASKADVDAAADRVIEKIPTTATLS